MPLLNRSGKRQQKAAGTWCVLVPDCNTALAAAAVLLLLMCLTSHVRGCCPLSASLRCAASFTQLAM
jgi:hypothetical protein